MAPDTAEAKALLLILDRKVASGRYRRARNWGGAGVVVGPHLPTEPMAVWFTGAGDRNSSFYPPPRQVSTDFPRELSWLFKELWKGFAPLFGPDKQEFFGRLGNAANRYVRRTLKEAPRDLLGAVLHEAWAMLEELEDGSFRALPVALGREIADDWIDDAEREGYMTTEETRRWFAERGFE